MPTVSDFLSKLSLERALRSLHAWLGALILPWIVLAGLTGLYMNHRDTVLALLPAETLPLASEYEIVPGLIVVPSPESARSIAALYRPDVALRIKRSDRYRNRTVWIVDAGRDDVIIDRATGFVWLRERYRISAFAPDGTALGAERRWSAILSSLHQRGWIGEGLGRLLADITAIALVAFGISGTVLFYAPRLRRRRNRRARLRAARLARHAA